MGNTVMKFWSSPPDEAVTMYEGVQQNPVMKMFYIV
jgi:hypothetical protein